MIPLLREFLGFGIAVARFCGRRGVAAALLVGLGAMLEGVGILFLVPLLTVLFDSRATTTGAISRLFAAWLPQSVEPLAWLTIIIGLFAVLMVLRAVILWRRDSMLSQLQLGFVADQRSRLARRLGAARWPMLARLGHGRVTHAMGGDVQRISAGVQFLFQCGVALAALLCQTLVAFVLSPMLALVAVGLLLLGAVLMSTLLHKSSDIGRLLTNANLSLINSVGQFLGGIKPAIGQNIQHYFVRRFEQELSTISDQQVRFARQQGLLRGLWSLLGTGIAGVTIIAGHALLHLPAPSLIAFLVILVRINGPASQIQLGMQQIAYSLAAWNAVKAMDVELAAAESTAAVGPYGPWPAGPIVLEDITFRHPGMDPELKAGLTGVSLVIEPGEIVGLAGESGAGKTTLADLLCGLLTPQSGGVFVANIPLIEDNAPAWRDRVAYVAQDPVLFNESVRANLLWANPCEEDMIAGALAVAGADHLVERLPFGLDTIVGERGSLVSGGERQRLALARALLRKPDLLILDEATNAIDVAGEAEVLARLRAISRRPAVLMIAHRIESLRMCDRVLKLAQGRLTTMPRQA